MRRWVVLVLGLSTLALAGCGGSTGFVDGTVDNSVAASMAVGMPEVIAKRDFHGAPLDILHYNPGGECVYYRGVNESSTNRFTATGKEWEFCFQKNKLAMLLRTCAAPWKLDELDRYKKAGYDYNKAAYHGNATDCSH